MTRIIAQTYTVSVIDERNEIFPTGFMQGKRMDVLSGCPKQQGIEILLKTMGPQVIAVDEITSDADCRAVITASGCGVRLIATAHAASISDFQLRSVYAPLLQKQVFDRFLILHADKSFHLEAV